MSLGSDVGSLPYHIEMGRATPAHGEQTQNNLVSSKLTRSLQGHVALQRHGTEPGDNEVRWELALSLGGPIAHSEVAASLGVPTDL